MIIDTLYHWSPKENRKDIQQNGIQISHQCLDEVDFQPHYVCLGTTPYRAWRLLPVKTNEPNEYQYWDLWQVTIQDNDKLRIRGDTGSAIISEIRVFNTICPSQIWYIGTRDII